MTIYNALKAVLGREPTPAEIKAEMQRILEDGMVARAESGRLFKTGDDR
jgi:hypothetical protein